MRVEVRSPERVYGASFNINPNMQGSRLGTELLRKVINEYASSADFTADVYEGNPMLSVYTKSFGFEIEGTVENYHDTGATILNIIRRKEV
jgi:hypothetical protein